MATQQDKKWEVVPDRYSKSMWNREKIDLLFDWVVGEDFKEGDCIDCKVWMKALNIQVNSSNWTKVAQPIIRKLNKRLQQELHFHLVPLRGYDGCGYRILKSDQIMDQCERKMMLGARQIHRAVDSSKRIDLERIPPEARNEHRERQSRMAFIFQGIENSGLKLLPE